MIFTIFEKYLSVEKIVIDRISHSKITELRQVPFSRKF